MCDCRSEPPPPCPVRLLRTVTDIFLLHLKSRLSPFPLFGPVGLSAPPRSLAQCLCCAPSKTCPRCPWHLWQRISALSHKAGEVLMFRQSAKPRKFQTEPKRDRLWFKYSQSAKLGSSQTEPKRERSWLRQSQSAKPGSSHTRQGGSMVVRCSQSAKTKKLKYEGGER